MMHMSIGDMNHGGGPVQAKLQNVLSLRPKFGFDCTDRMCVVCTLAPNHSAQMGGVCSNFKSSCLKREVRKLRDDLKSMKVKVLCFSYFICKVAAVVIVIVVWL